MQFGRSMQHSSYSIDALSSVHFSINILCFARILTFCDKMLSGLSGLSGLSWLSGLSGLSGLLRSGRLSGVRKGSQIGRSCRLGVVWYGLVLN